jgi:nucleoside-diphosphate-sugar epimerase
VNPQTDRARRRADAERRLRRWGRESGVQVAILRVPGIYAADRLPLERIRQGVPVLDEQDDPYTNHIHAEDLARIVLAALSRGRRQRAYNAADGSWLRMGDYFDLVACHFGLPRPPRVSREAALTHLPAALMSFMGESRRLTNRRLREELRYRLRYPSVEQAIGEAARNARRSAG